MNLIYFSINCPGIHGGMMNAELALVWFWALELSVHPGLDIWLSNEAVGFWPVAARVLSAVPSCFLTARVAYEIPAETPLTHLDNLQ